jgi:fructose-1,6-bisphosphatase/inositol monophosphatase family enzyme
VSGCITVDLCHVADGALGGFLGIGGTIHPQDLAGPWAVLEEAGGTLLGLDGKAPELTPDPDRQMEVVASWSPASTRELLDFALTE